MRNQLHALLQQPVVIAAVRQRMEVLIATFDAHIAELDGELAAALRHDAAWAATAARLQTMPGIGIIATAWLLVATLHLSVCATPEAVAASAGLAPHPRPSGTRVRGDQRLGQSGHARLRAVLYLATLSAAQHNPVIKPFYDRLRAAGKPHKVARCAAARKLVHLAWAVATKGQPCDPHDQQRGTPVAPPP